MNRRRRIKWLSRSPNLSQLDYFLWDYLKGRVYKTKAQIWTVESLKKQCLFLIIIRNAMSFFYNRIAHCQTVNGEQFEHIITMIFKHQQNVFVKPIVPL